MIGSLLIGATRFLVGGKARWVGTTPSARQCIYFANHSSHLDTLVLWAGLPPSLRAKTRPVAAADYWDGDALRRHIALDVLNAVLIARGAGEAALEPVTEALQQGASLIVFPEGTRGPDLRPAPFKSGLYHLAKAFPQVDLVPVWLDNLVRAMPKGVFVPVPVSAVALFGAPLHLAVDEDRTAFLDRARASVVELGRSLHPELADG